MEILSIDNDGTLPEYKGEDLTLPPKRYERLEVNGEEFDLRDPENVDDALEELREYRQELRNGELDEYDGKSTDLWKGGRSELLYDEIRAKLAEDFHEGKHTLTWDEQNIEAKRIIKIRAAQLKTQGI